MAADSAVPRTATGLLLLADISGYTHFLELVSAEHPEMTGSGGVVPPAYPVLSSLLDVVVEHLEPAFTIAEIEGDAVFAYALDDRSATDGATRLLGVVRSAYQGFRQRVAEAMAIHKHDCQACMIFPSLELKFVVHHGVLVIQPIAGRERLQGPAVNVAHRLLKNSVTEDTGRRAYLFVTTAAAERVRLAAGSGVSHQEHYPDVGSIPGVVIALG